MLRNLFRVFSSQNNQKATSASYAPKCIEAAQLKLVAGGAPKGGWMEPEMQAASSAPKGGWA
jgi:UDP-N-acetylmuramoylalanine-D-glutamate ligase